MAAPAISTVSSVDKDRAISTIVLAFANDPVARWAIRDTHLYLSIMPDVVRFFGGRAFEHGTAYASEDLAGVALLLPPGVQPDGEALGDLFEKSVPDDYRDGVLAFSGQQEAMHPHEPMWYLPLTGVDPVRQGQGYGSALLTHALRECDRRHMPAYLESTSEASRRLYERFAFEAIGEISVPGSPKMWPMLRQPR